MRTWVDFTGSAHSVGGAEMLLATRKRLFRRLSAAGFARRSTDDFFAPERHCYAPFDKIGGWWGWCTYVLLAVPWHSKVRTDSFHKRNARASGVRCCIM